MSKMQSNIKENCFYTCSTYIKVEEIDGDNKCVVVTDSGIKWKISKEFLMTHCTPAEQFINAVAVSRTEMSKVIADAGKTAFYVVFDKQPKDEDLIQELKSLYANTGGKSTMNKKEYIRRVRKVVKAHKGERREMVCALEQENLDDNGYFLVRDLEEKAIRRVNPRTISSLIINETRYYIK